MFKLLSTILYMITSHEINEYTDLSLLFGACIHRVQGAGGNISIKTNTQMIIKASGYALSNTTSTSGYVVCNINKLKNNLLIRDENLQSAVEYPIGGLPSMETFFHLLPNRIIVHIHPTFFLQFLCSTNASTIFNKTSFPSSLFIPYEKPGLLLAVKIFEMYTDEKIIFLENHGIILCGERTEDCIDLYINALKKIESIFGISSPYSDLSVEKNIRNFISEITMIPFYLKPIYSVKGHLETIIKPITPDIVLFLKDSILSDTFVNKDKLYSYYKENSYFPSILYNNNYYVLAKSPSKCLEIEEILISYQNLLDNPIKYLSSSSINRLRDCPKEIFRLSK